MSLSLASTHLPVGGAQRSGRIRLKIRKGMIHDTSRLPESNSSTNFFSYNHLYSRCSLLTRWKLTAHQHSRCNRWKLPLSCWFRCFSAIFHDVEQKCCGIEPSVRLIPSVISLLQFINLSEGKLLTFILSPFLSFSRDYFCLVIEKFKQSSRNIINKQAVR